jgi:hypothetical protein
MNKYNNDALRKFESKIYCLGLSSSIALNVKLVLRPQQIAIDIYHKNIIYYRKL